MSQKNTVIGPKKKVIDMIKKALEQVERLPEFEKDAEEKISVAKSRLMQMEPFFAMLLFKMVTMPCYSIPTMATDGTVLLYNPIFVSEKLLRKDVLFILLHEIEHIFLKHNIRGPVKAAVANKLLQRQFDLHKKKVKDSFLDEEVERLRHKMKEWNFATDYVINGHIKDTLNVPHSKALEAEEDPNKAKERAMKDPGWIGMKYNKDFVDKDSEWVYEKIKTEPDPNQSQSGDCAHCGGSGKDPNGPPGKGGGESDQPCPVCGDDAGMGMGGVLPLGLGEITEQEAKALEKEFEGDVKAAAISAKKAGKLPAGVESVIEDLYTTSTPWQDILRTIFTSINKQDYTFKYPNKRYTDHQMKYGVIMPALWGEEYVDVGFICDTSGSMGEREKQYCASELRNILEDYPIRLHVLYCDTKAYVKDIQIFSREDIRNGKLVLKPKGGGGTLMRPAFDYYRDSDEHDFQVVICMTDMYLGDWGRLGPEPAFSTYWLKLPGYSNTSAKPDWGVVIDMIVEGENDG